MRISTNINIFYNCKVALTGYRFNDKNRLQLINKATKFKTKFFSKMIIADFFFVMNSNKNNFKKIDESKRLIFHNSWGPLVKINEPPEVFTELAIKMHGITKARNEKKLPPFGAHQFETTWFTNKDGYLDLAVNCKNLSEAILLAHKVDFHASDIKLETCLYFEKYGLREGCERDFHPKRGAKFCCESCKDIYEKNLSLMES